MDDALEQRGESESTAVGIKLVPTPSDWMNVRWHAKSNHLIECPVCFTAVVDSAIDEHTAWHQTIADVFMVLGRR